MLIRQAQVIAAHTRFHNTTFALVTRAFVLAEDELEYVHSGRCHPEPQLRRVTHAFRQPETVLSEAGTTLATPEPTL